MKTISTNNLSKIYILIFLGIFFLSGCSFSQTIKKIKVDLNSVAKSCMEYTGKWDDQYKECNLDSSPAGQEWCKENGGEYIYCGYIASAKRNCGFLWYNIMDERQIKING